MLRRGVFTTVDFPDADFTNAVGINPAGEIVGYYQSGGTFHGYFLSADGFTTIDPPGALSTGGAAGVIGINPSSEIAGYYDGVDGKTHAFLLSGGDFSSFDVPGSIFTCFFGINPAGVIVGSYIDSSGKEHGFVLNHDDDGRDNGDRDRN